MGIKVCKFGGTSMASGNVILAAADIVTVSNEEHAIAKIIYDIDSGAIDLRH